MGPCRDNLARAWRLPAQQGLILGHRPQVLLRCFIPWPPRLTPCRGNLTHCHPSDVPRGRDDWVGSSRLHMVCTAISAVS